MEISDRAPQMRHRLLAWYVANRRDLPWRRTRDPYAIWVSEIMLQQTRVAAVIDRFRAFMAQFPTIADLAKARDRDVLAQWSGLGYYRRARMLHRAAQQVVEECGGVMPSSAVELRKLPGIGAYTAAAIASIAYGEVVAVVDGNVERVLCRVAGWSASHPHKSSYSRKISALAGQLVDPSRPGDFNQAIMELGATLCLPRNPQCMRCPIHDACITRGEHKTVPRPRLETRSAGFAFCIRGERTPRPIILLEQRPSTETVMPGMWALPVLRDTELGSGEAVMTVRHAIMQVNYRVRIRRATEAELKSVAVRTGRRRWVPSDELSKIALTGLARKVLTRAGLMPSGTGG